MAILKALEYIQYSKADEKTVLVYTDSWITLQLLQNQNKHTHIIEQIRTKVIEMEQQEWIVEFSWIKAHTEQSGNELADQLAKEAVSSKTIEECYTRIPKSAVWSELNEQSVKQRQNEWEKSSKGVITKSFFPKIVDRLKLRINATPNFTTIVTGHGNIKMYLYKYKITESPMCSCKQSVDYILYECKRKLLEHKRDRLKAAVKRSENWPVSKDKRSTKFYKNFKEFANSILLDKVQCVNMTRWIRNQNCKWNR